MKQQIRKWDPTFGWNNEIYNLASYHHFSDKGKVPFFLRKGSLMKGNKILLKSTSDYRICAGDFSEDFYFGSLSYVDKTKEILNLDQSVVVYNKKFELLSEFRPSFEIEKPSKNFTKKKIQIINLSMVLEIPQLCQMVIWPYLQEDGGGELREMFVS